MAKKLPERKPIQTPSNYYEASVVGGLNDFFVKDSENWGMEEGISSVLGVMVGNTTASKFSNLKSNAVENTIFGKDFGKDIKDKMDAIKVAIETNIAPYISTISIGLAYIINLLESISNNSLSGKLDLIISLKDPKDFDTLSQFIDSMSVNPDIKNKIDEFKENIKLLQEVFDVNIQTLYNSVVAQKTHIDEIEEAIKKSTEVATSAAKIDAKELEESRSNVADIIDSIALLGLVMLLGGLIITKNEKLIEGSLKFGITLTAFLLTLMVPITILTAVNKYLNSDNNLDAVMSFLIVSTAIMMIGAAFMFIPRLPFMALKFTRVFTSFLLFILLPISLISLVSKSNALQQMQVVASFIKTATFIMILGAAIMVLGGGKYVKEALKFGIVLGVFILTVLTPVIIYGMLVKKAAKLIDNYASLVVTASALMILGALIFTYGGGAYVKNALKFGVVLGLFILCILAPIIVYSVLIKEGEKTLKWFTRLIVTATIVMLLGAYFAAKKDWVVKSLAFGFILMAFMTLCIAPILVLGLILKNVEQILKQFTIFLLAETAIMLMGAMLVMKHPEYIIGALAFGIVLTAFVSLTLWPFLYYQKKIEQAIPGLVTFGAFIFVVGVTMMLSAFVIDRYFKGALVFTVCTGIFVAMMYEIVNQLGDGRKEAKLKRGITNAYLIAGLCAAFGLAFGIVDTMLPEGKDLAWLTAKMVLIGGFIVGMTFVLKLISKVNAKDLIWGTLAMSGIAVIIGLLGFSLRIVNESNITLNTLGSVGIMAASVTIFAVILGIMGVAAKEIALGELAAAGMAVVMSLLGWSMQVVHNSLVTVGGGKKALGDAGKLALIAGAYALMFACLIPFIYTMPFALIAVGLITAAVIPLTGAIFLISKAVKIATETGDVSAIKSVFDAFKENAIPSVGVIWFSKSMAKIGMITSIVTPLCYAMGRIGRTVADLASLKVAIDWDKNGNPIKYRQLTEKDFKLAAEGVTKIITTMADGIMQAAAYYENIDIFTLNKTLFASQKLGNVIGSISTGLQSYANLLIPIDWNDEGKPIQFRKMTDKDFTDAAMNIRKVILLVGGTIATLAAGSGGPIKIGDITVNPADFVNSIQDIPATGLRGLFGSTNPSNFIRVLTASSQLGEMVSNIAAGIQAFASMNMPVEWNNEGKPIKFKALGEKEITNASNNVRTILLTLAGAIMDVYNDPRSIVDGRNIFDSEVIKTGFLGLKKTETPSRFEKTLGASIRLGELIASVATGLQAMANLRIPNAWNVDGKPISFVNVDLDTLKVKVPSVISDILLSTTLGVMKAYRKVPESTEKLQEVFDAFLPVGTLISNISKALQNYIKLRIPGYDDKGNIVNYTDLPDDFAEKVTVNVGNILLALSTALVDTYKKMELDPIVLDTVFNAFMPIGKLIKDTADAIVSYAAGYVVDPKTGKKSPIGPEVIASATKNIQDIIICIVDAIATVYNNHPEYFKDKEEASSLFAISNQLIKSGELVKSTVELIKEFAKIKSATIDTAADNITKTVSAIPQAIMNGLQGYNFETTGTLLTNGIDFLITVNNFLDSMFKNVVKTLNDNHTLLVTLLNFKKTNSTNNELYGIFSDIYVALDGIISCLYLAPTLSMLGSFGIGNLINALDMFSSIVIYLETFIPRVDNLSNILNTSVNNLNKTLFTNIIDIIKDINSTVADIYTISVRATIGKNQIAWALHDFYEKSTNIELYINKLELLNKKVKGFTYSTQTYANIRGAMSEVNSTIESIKESFNTQSNSSGIFDRFQTDDLDYIHRKVNTFSEIVREMINVSSMTMVDSSIFNTIGEGITTINEKVSKIDDNKIKQIDKETNSLSRFIKAVDSINVSKTSSLTSLMDSMANLANKMGGFDKLTDMINGDLKEVLSTLSDKIDEAKETIKRAERIEAERQKKLQDNIKNIKGLMQEAITINVGKLDDDNSIKAGYEKTK